MDPYLRVCRAFEKAGVRYVIVGAFGIIVQTGDRGPILSTEDCDFLLPPDPEMLTNAMRTLRRMGFDLEAGGKALPDQEPDLVAGILRARACVRGKKGRTRVDLPLEIAGYDFKKLWKRHRRIRIAGVTLRVGPIEALLRSKRLANRPKDRAFLEMYLHAARERVGRPRRR